MSEAVVYKIPKIKKSEVLSKLLVDPADIRKGLPTNNLPQLTQKGMIFSLTPHPAPLAKLSTDGTLKITLKYTAESIQLIDRYIQITVIDDYDQYWVGNFFGVTVKGYGGKGNVRGCKVKSIQGQTIIAQFVQQGQIDAWKKFQTKVQEILEKNK